MRQTDDPELTNDSPYQEAREPTAPAVRGALTGICPVKAPRAGRVAHTRRCSTQTRHAPSERPESATFPTQRS